MSEIVKIGTVELTEAEAEKLYNERKYIVTYSKIYEIRYSDAQQRYYSSLVYSKPTKGGVGLTKRGRFVAMDAAGVNAVIGGKLLVEN